MISAVGLLALSLWNLEAPVDQHDLGNAVKAMQEDLPWTAPLKVTAYCLQCDNPYTLRVKMTNGKRNHTIDCVRPWRTFSWMCDDANLEHEYGCLQQRMR